jgi:EmrB/QacA subfamily drug resistance transporter
MTAAAVREATAKHRRPVPSVAREPSRPLLADGGGPSTSAADPRRWKALAVLGFLQFMLVLDATVVNVALPSIKADLGFSQPNLAWVVDAYLLAAGGFLLLGGRLADLLGRRRIFLAGAIAFALGSAASGLAQDQAMLIGARAVQGLGEALAGPAALSIIAVLFTDRKEKTKALSVWGGLAGLAGVLGVVMSGVIVDLASWRWIFLINLPVAAGVLISTPRLVRNDRHATGHGFDFAGAATLTAGITAAVYALLEANRNGWSSSVTVCLLMVASVLLAAFVGIERAVKAPLVPLAAFRARGQRTASVQMVFFVAAMYAMFFLLTLYMQVDLRWSPLHTGLAYLPFGLCMLVGIGASSQLVPRFGVRPVSTAGMVLAASGFWFFSRVSPGSGYAAHVLPGLALVALGAGLGYVAVTVLGVSDARQNEAGLASGIITTAQQVGGALGLAAFVSIATARASASLAAGHSPVPAQLAGSSLAFAIGIGVLAAGALFSALAVPGAKPPKALALPDLTTVGLADEAEPAEV